MRVYADNAATTAMSQTAIDAMLPYFNKIYGNPSSLHSIGQEAKEALDAARATVAQCLGCEPREVYFTSGGCEADNQAIISAARFGEFFAPAGYPAGQLLCCGSHGIAPSVHQQWRGAVLHG